VSPADRLLAEAKRLAAEHGQLTADGLIAFTPAEIAALIVDARKPLALAGAHAAGALQAAEKITRGAGSPKTADIIAEKAAALVVELQRAAGEIA